MSIASALLNAQRRPEEEARRFTEAVAVALSTSDDVPDISTFLAATDTLTRVNEEIAEEKAPRVAAPAPGHTEQFDDQVIETFDDDGGIPLLPNTHRSDARYLLDSAHGDDIEDDRSRGAVERDLAIETHEDDADATATATDVDGDGSVESGVAQWVPDVAEPRSADAVELGGSPDLAGTDCDGDSDMSAEAAETLGTQGADDCEQVDGAAGPEVGEVPQWEWSPKPHDIQDSSPWGEAQELVASLPAPAAAPESDEPLGDVTERSPSPSARATEPPASFEEPEPDPGLSLKSRVSEFLSGQWRQLRVDPKASAKKIGIALAAVVLVSVIILSFTGGGRGKPPEPADAVAPPPQVENTTAPAKEVTLVPATVSTSCGNDSDAVAPFSGDKTRAWKCNRLNGLDLNVLNLTFNKPVVITSITIVPGFNYIAPDGRDEWSRHRVVTDVSWRMGGGLYPQEHIAPTRTGVTQKFPDVRTLMMSMTITGSARPPVGKGPNKGGIGDVDDAQDPKKVDETTAVSKIVITGYPVESDGGGLTPAAGR
ncbi:hypothetical protein BST43_19965 [Mycobacteroides saopaulense]|uniref:F5/8 type C domain-containing protein n=1 Tax=Mycobacteroides saopaulense TaxID=1578165 RepID=A0A1X0ITJ0_9MYCO|nr:hypothetical protein [Mycobacteroides saopaulense]ORB52029.1 hypothetical protein BST43_19965 [Mycobacteroides saopaulense]